MQTNHNFALIPSILSTMKKQRSYFFLFIFVFWGCSEAVVEDQNTKDIHVLGLTPAVVEALDLLCPDSMIIAKTEYGNFSTSLNKKPTLVTYPKLDLEHVVKLNPTNIITTKGMTSNDMVHKMRGLGFNVHVLNTNSLKSILKMYTDMGKLLGVEERGNFIYDSLNTELMNYNGKEPWSCIGVISFDPMYAYGTNTYFTDIINHLGGSNVLAQNGFPIVDKELFLTLNPDKIVTTNKEGIISYYKDRAVADGMNAFKDERNIIEVNSDWLSRPNHNVLKALNQINDQL